MKINGEIMGILRKLQPDTSKPRMEQTCPMCKRKLWVCEAGNESNECAGKTARRVLAKMEG